uniref:Dynein light intermediate chain n=1 Tax=Piliocolobus tephrosceles TaxID=591936 RepID=A0A8C9HCP5_9PRIM
MAPVGVEKKLLLGPNGPAVAAAGDLTSEEEEGQSLWSSILSEVSTRARSKLPSGKNILVFDHTRCNVWILDGDLYHKGLLKFAVSAESLPETLVIFVADMSRPWTVMESLQKWASVLREHIDKMKIPPEKMRELERKFVKDFQDYMEPEECCQGSPQRRGPLTSGSDEENVALPLGDNVLTHNLGIPVLVVCTKCDAVSVLEKEHDYRDEHLDFIQSHLRRFCLQYGAALIYTSVKEEKNLDLLYKYIVHKTYGFHFTTPALVVEKDAVFM